MLLKNIPFLKDFRGWVVGKYHKKKSETKNSQFKVPCLQWSLLPWCLQPTSWKYLKWFYHYFKLRRHRRAADNSRIYSKSRRRSSDITPLFWVAANRFSKITPPWRVGIWGNPESRRQIAAWEHYSINWAYWLTCAQCPFWRTKLNIEKTVHLNRWSKQDFVQYNYPFTCFDHFLFKN